MCKTKDTVLRKFVDNIKFVERSQKLSQYLKSTSFANTHRQSYKKKRKTPEVNGFLNLAQQVIKYFIY